MKTIRMGRLLASLTVVLLVLAGPALAAGLPKHLLPDDVEAVFFIDIKAVLQSGVVKTHALDPLKKALDNQPAAGVILQQLGLDPWKDLSSLTVAVCKIKVAVPEDQPPEADAEVLVFVTGNFDVDKFTKLVKQADNIAASQQDGVAIYEMKEGPQPVFAAFLGAERLVAANRKDRVVAAIGQHAGKKQPTLNKGLAGMLDKVGGKQSMWMAMTLPETVKTILAAVPQVADVAKNIEGVTMGVTLTDSIVTEILVHTTDKGAAADIRRGLEQAKALATVLALNDKDYGTLIADVLNEIRISNDGNSAKVKVDLTPEKIADIVKKIREIRAGNKP